MVDISHLQKESDQNETIIPTKRFGWCLDNNWLKLKKKYSKLKLCLDIYFTVRYS